jgi:hypothetical protein
MSHCIGAFNMRCREMNLPECRLALFLDPRYKAAADAPGKFPELMFTVRSQSSVQAIRTCLQKDKDVPVLTRRMSLSTGPGAHAET